MSLKLGLLASSQQQAASLLLDVYPSASAAYSIRKLKTSYSGSCIRIRRDSDNSEIDIGFNSNNIVNTTLISSFCGLATGFVTKWYDQSGIGVDAIPPNAASQPQIIFAGTIFTQNGKPCIKLAGGAACFIRTGTMPLIERSFAVVTKGDTYQQDAGIISFRPSGGGTDFNSPDAFEFQTANVGNSSDYAIAGSTGVSYFLSKSGGSATLPYGLYMEIKTTNTGQLYNNSALIATDSSFTQFNAFNTQALGIGVRLFTNTINNNQLAGIFQEFVYWSISNNSNRTGIETNINSFYTIY